MAISPPSDILLDVASAADPASVRMATARLARLAADPAAKADNFSKALAAAQQGGTTSDPASGSAWTTSGPSSTLTPPATSAAARAAPIKKDAYQRFEAVLLTNFVESMLPKDEELFGDKQSAGVYRSMMAEQFANQIAKAGGIGIAKAIEHAHPSTQLHVSNPPVSPKDKSS